MHDRLACERCHGPNRETALTGTGPECVRCHAVPRWAHQRTVDRTTERGRSFDEAQSIVLFGLGSTWRVRANHHFDVDYDGVLETELQDQRNAENLFIHTGMLRYSWLY